jgi:four helix bundle protein
MANEKGSEIRARAFNFAVAVVKLADVVVTRGVSAGILGKQLLRSAASIGANLEEADAGQSRADFASKCGIALREARESHYWLRLLHETGKITAHDRAEALLQECHELVAILTTIVRRTRATRT